MLEEDPKNDNTKYLDDKNSGMRREVDVDMTRQIVEGFADVGVTCAVLAPEGLGESRLDQIDKLARRTDILVLDWNIGNSKRQGDGKLQPSQHGGQASEKADPTALSLIERIVRQDAASGGRLRLIAIYTSESDLRPIIDDLMTRLSVQFEKNSITRSEKGIRGEHLLITLYQKPLLRSSVPGLSDGISPKELIPSILSDFDDACARGLFQQLALTVLSRVRDQASRILARFDSELDPALIGHRAQTSHRDSIVFALALLGSELASLVRTADISSVMSEEMVHAHIDRLIGEQDRLFWDGKNATIKPKSNVATREFLCDAGSVDARSRLGDIGQKTLTVSSLMLDASDETELKNSVKKVEHAFAVLCCSDRSAAFDGKETASPTLEFGSMIEKGGQYLLCVQPVCDSVRVDRPREFIFLPMRKSRESMKFDLIVVEGKESVPLVKQGETLACTRGLTFEGDARTLVVTAKRHGSERHFVTIDRKVWRWVANIREAYVRRILTGMVTDMTRVGLDESEFMHRKR